MERNIKKKLVDSATENGWTVVFFSKTGSFQSIYQNHFNTKSIEHLQITYFSCKRIIELLSIVKHRSPYTVINISSDGYSPKALQQLLLTIKTKLGAQQTQIILWIPGGKGTLSFNDLSELKVNDIRNQDEIWKKFDIVLQLSMQQLISKIELNSFYELLDSEVKLRTKRLSQFNKKLKKSILINDTENQDLIQQRIEIEKQKNEIELRNAELEQSFKKSSINHIKLQKVLIEIQQKNEELQTKNEEITSQRDYIEQQNEEIQAQRDVALLQQDEIRDNILYASRIQQALLPPPDLMNQLLPIHFILNLPKDIVSGDFYWVSQNRLKTVVAVADCTGHGISGAMMSMLGTAFLNEIINKNDITNSSQILSQLRERIIASLHQEISNNIEYSRDGMDIAVCIIDILDNTLEYSGANNSLYLIRSSEFIELKADKMPIGIHDFCDETFNSRIVEIKSGDSIYLFSDGFPDQFGGKYGKKLKYHKFKKILLDLESVEFNERKNVLNQIFTNWKGELEQIDDVMILGFMIP